MKPKNPQHGMTIIEIVIVIALIVIVGLVAIPTYNRIVLNSNLRTATREVAADLALLKERALSEHRLQRLSLDTASWNGYTLQRCQNTGSNCTTVYEDLQIKQFTAFGVGIVISPPPATSLTQYTVQTRGTISAGTVQLTNSRGSTATITINVAGRISVQYNMQ